MAVSGQRLARRAQKPAAGCVGRAYNLAMSMVSEAHCVGCGAAVTGRYCADCGEQHYHEWSLLRASLQQLLDEGQMRPHEPAFDPDEAHYVTC